MLTKYNIENGKTGARRAINIEMDFFSILCTYRELEMVGILPLWGVGNNVDNGFQSFVKKQNCVDNGRGFVPNHRSVWCIHSFIYCVHVDWIRFYLI